MSHQTFKEQGIDSFPLCWPSGWRRQTYRKASKFKTSFERARIQLFKELKLLGCGDWNVILSTNIPLRRDGMPYANQANPQDPGVAVYFRLKDRPMVFACDQYKKAEENLYAITKTVEALRGISRWGASDMMERSFTGFAALPPPPRPERPRREWWEVLEFAGPFAKAGDIQEQYKRLAMTCHPDQGGTNEKMAELNRAREEGMRGK